jgi:hypothetical protein
MQSPPFLEIDTEATARMKSRRIVRNGEKSDPEDFLLSLGFSKVLASFAREAIAESCGSAGASPSP